MYVPAWLTVIVWLVVPTFVVGNNNEPSLYHANTAVVVDGATLDLIFKVAAPQRAVEAPVVAVETIGVAETAFTVTEIALLATTHVPTVTFTEYDPVPSPVAFVTVKVSPV